MRNLRCLAILLIFFCQQVSAQNPKVLIQPKKPWLEKFSFNMESVPPAGQESGYYYLLLEKQENAMLQEVHHHYAYKFLSTEGVQQMSDISVAFDPKHEVLIFHEVVIYRNGEVINKMPAKIKTIQREESMDRFLYDESYTALINLPDIRTGDVLEYSYTLKGYNPVFKGRVMREFYVNQRMAYDKKIFRLTVPSSVQLNIKNVNTSLQPVVNHGKNEISYLWINEKAKGLITDGNTPSWYNPFQRVVISSFKDWKEVSDWGTELFRVSDADKMALQRETDELWRDLSGEEFVMNAIRFVQDDVRYLGFESGLNGYQPHSPLKVFNQRFGDCKDKSLLLCTMLETRGIDAYPMLVNTADREKITDGLPSAVAFNHCVVQVKFRDKVFYIDPTISNQGGTLGTYSFPYFEFGLVLNNAADLTSLPSDEMGFQEEIQTFRMDSIGGGSTMEVRTVFRGSAADGERSYLANARLEAILKKYKNYYANQYPDIAIADDLKVEDDREKNEIVTIEKYRIKSFWKKEVDDSETLYCKVRAMSMEPYFNISKSLEREGPYGLNYPLDRRHEIHIHTPSKWDITPDDELFENDYYKYSYQVSYRNNEVIISTQYRTKGEAVPEEALETFVSDHGKMMANLSYYLSFTPGVQAAANAPVWPGILLLTILLIGGGIVAFYAYRNFDPQPYYPPAWGKRIEGLLYLPAIGLFISPVILLYHFFNDPILINGQAWVLSYSQGNIALFILTLLEQTYHAGILVFSLLMIILFFQRRSSVPRLIIYYYAVPTAWIIIDAILLRIIAPDHNVPDQTSAIMRGVVSSSIWIPYFIYSQRVKRTFVNTYSGDNHPDELVPQPVQSVETY